MNLFTQGNYSLKYFEPIHIKSLIVVLILCSIFLIIPYIFKGSEKYKYTLFLGIISLVIKTLDSIYRIYFEHEIWYNVIPLNLCNVSLIIGGLYLITRKNELFNILYFWFSGAILAIILPGIPVYHTKFYIFVYLLTHTFEVLIVFYAFIHLDERINLKGLIISILSYLLLLFVAKLWNINFGTNFMFIDDYIIKSLSSIKPFILYVILYTVLFIISMFVMYLPFVNNQPDELDEKEI